jgi:hypothetical protein
MNPSKVKREKIWRFTDLPNIGPAAARDFELLGSVRRANGIQKKAIIRIR